MIITGSTRCVPLVGHPVAQVHTPPAINAWFSSNAIDAVMMPMDVEPGNISGFFQLLRGWRNCAGCSVTVPHKQAAFAAVDAATPAARHAGAVNIIKRLPDGRLVGDMTDGAAFVEALRRNAVELERADILLAGAGGGAGSAIAAVLCQQGSASICLLDPNADRYRKIAAQLAQFHPGVRVHGDARSVRFDVAINASPLGMKGDDPAPFDIGQVKPGGMVADIVTKPVLTPLLLRARDKGYRIQTGVEMAEAQLEFQMRHLDLRSRARPDTTRAVS